MTQTQGSPSGYFFTWLSIFLMAAPAARGDPQEHIFKKTPQGDLKLYLHLPPGWTADDRRPAIVFFFGGGWRRGTVEQFRRQADYLSERGMVAARADYRVRSRHGTSADCCVADAKSAIRWLRSHAGSWGVDPKRIAAAGGSAGGHLAAAAAIIEGFDSEDPLADVSSRPNLLILFNPVMNTIDKISQAGSAEIARQISPNHHLTEAVPPTVLFYGTRDRLLGTGQQFMHSAQQLGIDARLLLAEGQGHGFFNRSPWFEETLLATDQFLNDHGYLAGIPTVQPIDEASRLIVGETSPPSTPTPRASAR